MRIGSLSRRGSFCYLFSIMNPARANLPTIRLMNEEDLPFADSLRETVKWNQTRADWRRLLALSPGGCFLAERDGAAVGTAATVRYDDTLGWIGMVLVRPEARGTGIGSALLRHSLTHLKARKTACIKLDATPAGRPLYEKMGFQSEWSLTRWEGEPEPASLPAMDDDMVAPLNSSELTRLAMIDKQAFGGGRQPLLESLAGEAECAVCIRPSQADGAEEGYGLLRPGSRALYLGPAVATSPQAGLAIASSLLRAAAGRRVFWDIPEAQEEAIWLAQRVGLTRQRPFFRMYLGNNVAPGNPRLQLAVADPALG